MTTATTIQDNDNTHVRTIGHLSQKLGWLVAIGSHRHKLNLDGNALFFNQEHRLLTVRTPSGMVTTMLLCIYIFGQEHERENSFFLKHMLLLDEEQRLLLDRQTDRQTNSLTSSYRNSVT
jgi:hypothetical protein